ncbi:MAG: IS200/IS605 family transposase [Pirellulaceae bacterium]|jgi:putative transposase|nr:IS200/IS605 family transposase [Pirellulaceae bacterium]
MVPSAVFTAANTTAAYQLRYHFGWCTRGRQPCFNSPELCAAVNAGLADVARRHDYHLLESTISPMVVRSLVSLQPHDSPSRVTGIVRGNLSKSLRERWGMRDIWSRGAFFRSVGTVTGDVIRQYIAGQFAHHGVTSVRDPARLILAQFHDARDAAQLRSDAHARFEYNVHVVLVTDWRVPFLDLEVAEALVGYWRQVCEKKEWIAWDIEVVSDHAHLFLGLRPVDAPQSVALSLMNNSEHYCERRYVAAMRDAKLSALWRPSFYVGTAGAATTAQVRSFLLNT